MKIKILSRAEKHKEISDRTQLTEEEYPSDLERKCRRYNLVRIGSDFYWMERDIVSEEEIRSLWLRRKLEGAI